MQESDLTLLSDNTELKTLTLTPVDNRRLADMCGQFDEHLRHIENELNVHIHNRSNVFQISGSLSSVDKAYTVLEQLYQESKEPNNIDSSKVHLYLQTANNSNDEEDASLELDQMNIQTRKRLIRPRSSNQFRYIQRIITHDLNFGIGPAGTGKTYLAVASAVAALEKNQVERIILVRPAVEAGERLGFLPGDMVQKVDPYLRPLHDALHEMLGGEFVSKLIEKNILEMAPLAYMRGRTLNDAFIILDESQNTTKEQMKMFLTRIGFSSKAVITGDITQIDLPHDNQSGLLHALTVLKHIDGIKFTFFQSKDIVRHPLVQRIVRAYDKADK